MQFKINNIGILSAAEVKLDGLTVIGGENDTGKSTVGKLLFAIIKGIARYEQDLRENWEENVDGAIEDVYFSIRRTATLDKKFQGGDITAFEPKVLRAELKHIINKDPETGLTADDIKYIEDFFEKKIKLVSNYFDDKNLNKVFNERAFQKLQNLKNILLQEVEKGAVIKRALKRAFNSEFYSEISPKNSPKTASKIILKEGNSSIFEINIKENEIESFELTDLLFFEDVTFIETPVLLQMYEVIRNADTLLDLQSDSKESRLQSLNRPKVSLHIKDALTKMERARLFTQGSLFSDTTDHSSLLNDIAAIIGGQFIFEKELRDFIFKKKHNGSAKNIQVRAGNVASGIKSFGMIQLLVQGGFIDRRSLLIIDEPETHLHPKWQVEYARMLVALVKAEIPVLLTSHSPYMVQALKVFSEKEGLGSITNFYLAEKESKSPGAGIRDVTEDLNQLFQKLSEPLQQLVWE